MSTFTVTAQADLRHVFIKKDTRVVVAIGVRHPDLLRLNLHISYLDLNSPANEQMVLLSDREALANQLSQALSWSGVEVTEEDHKAAVGLALDAVDATALDETDLLRDHSGFDPAIFKVEHGEFLHDIALPADQLQSKYLFSAGATGEHRHPALSKEQWRKCVNFNCTALGYWDWVADTCEALYADAY